MKEEEKNNGGVPGQTSNLEYRKWINAGSSPVALACEFCGKEYKKKGLLVIHENYYCKNNPNRKKRKPYSSRPRKMIEDGVSFWKCDLCEEVFPTRKSLYDHKKEKNHFIKTGTNQFLKAQRLGLPTPVFSDETKKKISEKSKLRKHTNESKQKISHSRSIYLSKENSGGFRNVKWYYVKNINNEEFCVRGTWELKYALYLNENNILWVRNKTLNYSKNDGVIRTYFPDFFLLEEELFIEIKGYFSDGDKEKMRLVQDQNNVKIKMLFYKDLNGLGII